MFDYNDVAFLLNDRRRDAARRRNHNELVRIAREDARRENHGGLRRQISRWLRVQNPARETREARPVHAV